MHREIEPTDQPKSDLDRMELLLASAKRDFSPLIYNHSIDLLKFNERMNGSDYNTADHLEDEYFLAFEAEIVQTIVLSTLQKIRNAMKDEQDAEIEITAFIDMDSSYLSRIRSSSDDDLNLKRNQYGIAGTTQGVLMTLGLVESPRERLLSIPFSSALKDPSLERVGCSYHLDKPTAFDSISLRYTYYADNGSQPNPTDSPGYLFLVRS